MKILYSTLALLLYINAPLYCMEEEQRQLGFPSSSNNNDADISEFFLADAAEQSGVPLKRTHTKGPSTIFMERVDTHNHEEASDITTGFFAMPTKEAGSDEYAQEDVDNDPTEKKSTILITKIFEEHVIPQSNENNNNQGPQMTPLIPQLFDKIEDHKQKSNFSWTKILEIFKADDERQKELLGDNNLSEVISRSQNETLKVYYSSLAHLGELTELFWILKSKLSKMPIEEKKLSVEFEHKNYIYAGIIKRCSNNKEEAKALLLGVADYESDEEKIIDGDLENDEPGVYRLSKNILTYALPALTKRINENQASVDSSIQEKELIDNKIAVLEKQKQEVLAKLNQELTNKRQLKQAELIIKQERETQREYLLRKQATLKKAIVFLEDKINDLSHQSEEAVLQQANDKKILLNKQKKATEEQLSKTKLILADLEKNLKNFDTPTGYKLWRGK